MGEKSSGEGMQTPFFVIDKRELEKQTQQLTEAIQSYWNNAIVSYSFKTNSLPWVVDYFRKQGFYAEVVSDDEYNLARYMKFDQSRIVYNGIIKSEDTFLEALEHNCIVNIDSEREIKWLAGLKPERNYTVGIRVNFDLEELCPGQTQCGSEGGRFGFCRENGELAKAIQQIQEYPNVEVKGLHLHCSSKTRSIDIYKAICKVSCEVKNLLSTELEYIDVGGGFFGGMENRPQFTDYLSCIAEALKDNFSPERTTLILEPGMSLIGSPIDFVTSVIDVKKTNRNTFVVTDGSRNNIDPLMTKTAYFHDICYADEPGNRETVEKQVVVGYTCMEHDRLFELLQKSRLQVGDKIIYHKVGAYTMCLSPLFIKYFPKVYVRDGETYELVREHWTYQEYAAKSFNMEGI